MDINCKTKIGQFYNQPIVDCMVVFCYYRIMAERLSHRAIREREIETSRLEIASVRDEELRSRAKNGRSCYDFWGNTYNAFLDHSREAGRKFSFQSRFSSVLPREYQQRWNGLQTYIEDVLSSKKGTAIGLELGGPGSNLFGGFHGVFKQTAGICLVDCRDEQEKQKDKERNHSVLEGDILSPEGKHKVASWLGGNKADVVIMSMVSPHQYLPKEPFFMAQQTSHWYELSSDTGLFLAEGPFAFDTTLDQWEQYIRKNVPGIEVQSDIQRFWSSTIRLRKLPSAPSTFPTLPARMVLSQQRHTQNFTGAYKWR